MAGNLKQKLRSHAPIVVYGLGQFISPKWVELIALTGGYDAVWFDQEHAGVSQHQIESAALAARGFGLDCFVRLAPVDYASVMRPLETGAGGIMAAQVRTSAEVERIVRWTYFYPLGERGLNGLGADGRYGSMPVAEYIAQANSATMLAIQIEHVQAVQEADAIARQEGVDMLFIGPADLSQSLGIPGQWDHPHLWAAIERVAQAAERHRKAWGIVPASPAMARRCTALGCRCLSIGFDCWTLHAGLRVTKEEYADFFRR
ncbi:MAG: aldolase [Gemmataceae bacterium]